MDALASAAAQLDILPVYICGGWPIEDGGRGRGGGGGGEVHSYSITTSQNIYMHINNRKFPASHRMRFESD